MLSQKVRFIITCMISYIAKHALPKDDVLTDQLMLKYGVKCVIFPSNRKVVLDTYNRVAPLSSAIYLKEILCIE